MSTSQNVKAWRNATKERMVAAMGGQCQCCRYNRCMESLDFHHLNPDEKEMSLGSARANPRAWPVIVNELRKCILICHNCHGEIHYGKRQLPDIYARFDERYAEYKSHPDLSNECPTCGTMKPIYLTYCSSDCVDRRRIDWNQYDLAEMGLTMTSAEIADHIKVSRGAVEKRMKKMGIYRPQRNAKRKRTYTPFVYVKLQKKEKTPLLSSTDPKWRHRPNLKLRKVERPSKEDLEKMIWAESLESVGRRLGVNGNSVRKWAKAYGIGLPPQGYHTRRLAGYTHEESLVSQKHIPKVINWMTQEIAERASVMRAKGLSYREIGEALGFGHWTVQQGLRRYGFEADPKVAAQDGAAPSCP